MPRVLTEMLVSVYDWLACADQPDRADLIFALAGRQSRKSYALELLAEGKGKQILVSVGRYEIRRFAWLVWPVPVDLMQAVADVPPPRRHLFVSYSAEGSEIQLVPLGPLGTWTEIQALGGWLRSHQDVRSLIIVSSGAHLRRVRLCCKVFLPSHISFRLSAVDQDGPHLRREFWWRDRKSRDIVLSEFPKLVLYWSLLQVQRLVPKPGLSLP